MGCVKKQQLEAVPFAHTHDLQQLINEWAERWHG
jgi:hypothetical protein